MGTSVSQRKSRYLNTLYCYLYQPDVNLFSRLCDQIVIFKNARDAMQISNLARKMYPGNSKFMIEAFKDATSGPYGYSLIDMKPYTEEAYRLRTNILPGETHYVYVRK